MGATVDEQVATADVPDPAVNGCSQITGPPLATSMVTEPVGVVVPLVGATVAE
jgi:hypothetical protein